MPIYFKLIAYPLVNKYTVRPIRPTIFLLIIIAILRDAVDRQDHLALEHVVVKFAW